MSSMETIFYGASPMSPAKLARAIEDWGPIFFQFYGQTEAPMVITHLKKGEHDPRVLTASRRVADRCRGCTSPCSTPTTDPSPRAGRGRSALGVRW